VRAGCITVLGARGASEYLDQVYDEMMDSEDDGMRRAAIRFVGRLDHPRYKYGRELIRRYLETDDEVEAGVCAEAIVDMFMPDNGPLVYGSVFSAMVNSDGKIKVREVKRACRIAREVGGYRGSQMVIMFGESDDPAVWRVIEETLLHWPDPLGSKAVMALVVRQKMPGNRRALLREYVRMVGEMEEARASFRATGLGKALALSKWDDIDTQAFRALSYVDDFSSIDAVLQALADRSYANAETVREAARALVIVSEKIGNENLGKGEDALNKVIELLSGTMGDGEAGALLERAKKALGELRG